MTLINCRECGKEISDTSKRCIHCGAKIKKEKIKKEKNKEVSKNKKKLILIILGIILIIGTIITIYFLLNNNVEQTNLRDDTKSQVEIITDYINIRENPNVSSDVLGKVYQGEIYTILSENNDSEYKWIEIETSNGIRGYISGVEDYVKRLYTPNNEEQPPIDNPIIDNNNTSNENNTNTNDNQKPNNNTNNSQKPNNNTNNNNNNNNNNENYTPQLKACLKTCDSGYVLKNEDSVDCYCEKIPVEKTVKEKLIEVMKKNGYTCTSVQCTKSITEYDANLLDYTETFAINFYYQKISLVFVDYRGIHHGKAEIFYGTNTATSEYWLDGTNPDYGKATCSQVFPSLSCSNVGMPSGKKSVNKALDKLNKLLAEANISIDDLKNSK